MSDEMKRFTTNMCTCGGSTVSISTCGTCGGLRYNDSDGRRMADLEYKVGEYEKANNYFQQRIISAGEQVKELQSRLDAALGEVAKWKDEAANWKSEALADTAYRAELRSEVTALKSRLDRAVDLFDRYSLAHSRTVLSDLGEVLKGAVVEKREREIRAFQDATIDLAKKTLRSE